MVSIARARPVLRREQDSSRGTSWSSFVSSDHTPTFFCLQAYCPIVRASKNDHPVIVKLSKKHNKDPGQILIRWSLQKGYIPLPKSDTPSRIHGNIDVYSFELDKEDMEELDKLDEGEKGAIAPYNLNCK